MDYVLVVVAVVVVAVVVEVGVVVIVVIVDDDDGVAVVLLWATVGYGSTQPTTQTCHRLVNELATAIIHVVCSFLALFNSSRLWGSASFFNSFASKNLGRILGAIREQLHKNTKTMLNVNFGIALGLWDFIDDLFPRELAQIIMLPVSLEELLDQGFGHGNPGRLLGSRFLTSDLVPCTWHGTKSDVRFMRW